ncbi:conditional loss-of-growth 1 [Anaeramoeba ignava]|uniref:Conditional loss-of-growth 1 n=1 Tax=Anaeramoeba ignava TaxID=1746090 RepID=A0A9Q0RD99_ANAIG|nr:conditional loss-of-growth 1 [Anaeramoeba ignava]
MGQHGFLRFFLCLCNFNNELIRLLKIWEKKIIHSLLYIFNHLPENEDFIEAKAACLVLLSQKCKKKLSDLKSIGGIEFFKDLLDHNQPLISFHASSFLTENFQIKFPDKFKSVMKMISKKAQQLNQIQLLKNPYFFIKETQEILERQKTKKKYL